MRVVQIAGPSYSGSTVLGYVLNASAGWFFGSEVYRLLPSFTHRAREGRAVYCAACGEACAVWNSTVRERIVASGNPSVQDVYRVFAQEHPGVTCFVDGSKALGWFDGAWSEQQLISAKHPMRMVASFLHHQQERLGLAPTATLEDFRAAAADDPQPVRRLARRILMRVEQTYEQILDSAPSGRLCRTDELHLDGFAEYRQVCDFVGAEPEPEHVVGFNRHPVHPIGGNKAPLWQRWDKDTGGREAEQSLIARRRYYARAGGSLGDYRMDDKWAEMLPAELVHQVRRLPPYRRLCRMLGYPPAPPTVGDGAGQSLP